MKAAGPLQKLLHLANAREALALGDLPQALNEAEAAIDADATFAAAQTLRAEIVARMDAAIVFEPVVSVAAAVPVAVAMAVTADPEPVAPAPPIPVPVVVPLAPRVAPKATPGRRRARASTPTGLAITLGTLVVVGGVGVALLATGIIGREPSSPPVRQAVVQPATPPRATPSDVVLPAPVRPRAAAASVTAAIAKSDASPAEPASTWASSRLAQLSVRPRSRASALHVDDSALLRDLGQGIGELWIGKLTGNEDVVFVGGSLDASEWMKLRASIKPTGVVWRIYSNRSSSSSDGTPAGAVTAGFSRVKKVRYSADYSGEQYALRRLVK